VPINAPALDDRGFADLVEELLARIPAHTPDWTNPRLGDPGRTLLELFAWLTDTLLYRVNLIPERQRLTFLRLLGQPMRPAMASTGIVTLSLDDPKATGAAYVRPNAVVKGPVGFETTREITVLPATAEAYYKRPLSPDEAASMRELIDGLREVYELTRPPAPYVTTPVFAGGRPEPGGFDLIERAADKSVWLALLAQKAELVEQVRDTLSASDTGGQQLLSVGVVPGLEVPALFEEIGPRAQVPHIWEMSYLTDAGELDYMTIEEAADSTSGLTKPGVVRLALPARKFIGAPSNDVREFMKAGVDDSPPRIDAPEVAKRLVTWIRLRPTTALSRLDLSWVGVNAAEIDQRQTVTGRVIAASDGTSDQVIQLPGSSVEPETLVLQVEETGRGYQSWIRVDDIALAGRDDPVFELDAEAGTLKFGDGVRGRIPESGRRIRVAQLRAGGGDAGNLGAEVLTGITATLIDGTPAPKLKLFQPLPTLGGTDPETLEEAERRIPQVLRHSNRVVTEADYRQLAGETPAARLGRVELLQKFKPQQRRFNIPGVVSVMVLPYKESPTAPYPRPDRPTLERVHAYLDTRRPLATELYVIGCEYVQLGIGTAVSLQGGFATQQVLTSIRDCLRRLLWALPPGGSERKGWPLGGPVRDRELEVAISQVPGVSGVAGVNLFRKQGDGWSMIPRTDACAPVELRLEPWQLPELLSVVVLVDESAPNDLSRVPNVPQDLDRVPNPFAVGDGIAIPVVPQECR
jgi:hypothetical protein